MQNLKEERIAKEKCIQKLFMYLIIPIHVLLMLRLFRPRAYIQIYSNTGTEEEHLDFQNFQRRNNFFFRAGTNSSVRGPTETFFVQCEGHLKKRIESVSGRRIGRCKDECACFEIGWVSHALQRQPTFYGNESWGRVRR